MLIPIVNDRNGWLILIGVSTTVVIQISLKAMQLQHTGFPMIGPILVCIAVPQNFQHIIVNMYEIDCLSVTIDTICTYLNSIVETVVISSVMDAQRNVFSCRTWIRNQSVFVMLATRNLHKTQLVVS